MSAKRIHLIGNSHIDPIWLWNFKQGHASILNTMHSTVSLMEREPDLKFTCSSALAYRWIEEADPALFRRIRRLVEQGRWELIGGWEVQSDTIITQPEVLIRQALVGKEYFRNKFGKDITCAYCVDSFGHTAGLPKILEATGFTHYVMARAQPDMPGLFRWKADNGAEIKTLRIIKGYGFSSSLTKEELETRIAAVKDEGDEEQTLFWGIGDHGGGIYRKHLLWLRELQDKYNLVFSTLEEYFKEADHLFKKEYSGELGPCFPGCYSNCHEVKRKVSRATRLLLTAERLGAPEKELEASWRKLLLAHFHDSLPGTSTFKAYEEDIFPLLGGIESHVAEYIDRSLAQRAAAFDTSFMSEGGVYLLNPSPYEVTGITAFDDFTDPNSTGSQFNALKDSKGATYPLQILPPDTTFGPCCDSWGKLTSIVSLPPFGETALAFARVEKVFAKLGFARQKELLKRLSLPVFFDNDRTWGFNIKSYSEPLGTATMVSSEEFIDGPACSVLRVKFRYESSEIQLDLIRYLDIPETLLKIRLDWQEKRTCLKLSLSENPEQAYFVTGQAATITNHCEIKRTPHSVWLNGKETPMYSGCGERAMIDWCGLQCADNGVHGFYAADLHGCDCSAGNLRVTLNRPVLHSDHYPMPQEEEFGWMDLGVSWRELWHFEATDIEKVPVLAKIRLGNIESYPATNHEPGENPAEKIPSFDLNSKHTALISLRRDSSGKWVARLINYGEEEKVRLQAKTVKVPAKSILTVAVR